MGWRGVPAAALVAAGLGGCAPRPPETLPPRVAVIDGVEVAGGAGLALRASGRRIDLAPPRGLCVSPDAVHPGADAAVAMLAPCSGQRPALVRMVSVSAAPLAEAAGLGPALDAMVAQAVVPGGWRALGLGLGDALQVISAAREADAAYFVVQEAAPGDGPPLGRRCRAIAQIEGRLVVATVAARAGDAAPEPERLHDEARRIIAAMLSANPAPPPFATKPLPRPKA